MDMAWMLPEPPTATGVVVLASEPFPSSAALLSPHVMTLLVASAVAEAAVAAAPLIPVLAAIPSVTSAVRPIMLLNGCIQPSRPETVDTVPSQDAPPHDTDQWPDQFSAARDLSDPVIWQARWFGEHGESSVAVPTIGLMTPR